MGQMVYNSKVDDVNMQVNTASFDEGMYFIQIKTDAGFTTKKVLLKK
jgi:hypothetical protein